MSFAGPPPSLIPPSGPFEEYVTKLASSPYSIGAAIFLLNVGGRFLPMEITKQQEKFLNQPWFRRLIVFVIFFVATRNLIIAFWLSLMVILFGGYLLNENSSLCIFGKASKGTAPKDTATLTPEEQLILKSLQDKSERLKPSALATADVSDKSSSIHDKYKKVMSELWSQ
jgi:hypothetical protein